MAYLSLEEGRALEEAIATIQNGGVVAFPTDTVYGIGASLNHREAMARIYRIKGRAQEKPIPILIARPDVIDTLTDDPDPDLIALANRFWPGPLTIILTANDALPPEVLAPDRTFGVRLPDHSVPLAIAHHNGGAIATTSANLSGMAPATTAKAIEEMLGDALDIILDGGIAPADTASTVIRREGATISVLREGSVTVDQLREAWASIVENGQVAKVTSKAAG
jgi:L-threonylcarbamoyladenylate synthase